jgi:hypothetical protein
LPEMIVIVGGGLVIAVGLALLLFNKRRLSR